MKKLFWIALIIIPCLFIGHAALAEDLPAGVVIPKIPVTADDPILSNGKVYPFWGPVCQRYTYSVVYSDQEGRPPEYVKIYFNGVMLDMAKEDPTDSDYKNGVKYIYQNVPDKYGSNFYYFEASNSLGRDRASIIDSPDNGPVLFDSDFLDNEIVLIDPAGGREIWRFPTGEEWVGGVALSADGNYLAAQTSNHIYFFAASSDQPRWEYESPVRASIGGDVKGGVAISADGSFIFAALNGQALFFNKNSSEPVWTYNLGDNGGGAYGVDISPDGQYAAVAMAGSESDDNTNVLLTFDADGNKLWQYHSSGNWHEVSFSSDGSYLAGATGCPDRRGYLFSINSAEPIIRSEPLSAESPVDEARISADGSLAVYGAESGYGAIILMDRQSRQVVWKYETPEQRSVRALAMTPDGEYIGAGTFGGDIIIFSKDSGEPDEQLKINSAIGAFDLADDGSFFATGSADKTVRIFSRGAGQATAEILLNEYVGELDISADGRYVAAGTSGAVYFFESLIDLDNSGVFDCQQVIEPAAEDTTLFGGQNGRGVVNEDSKTFNSVKSSGRLAFVWLALGGLSAAASLAGFLRFRRGQFTLRKKIILALAAVMAVVFLGAGFYLWLTTDSGAGGDLKEAEMSGNNSNSTGGTVINEEAPGEAVDQENSNSISNEHNVVETEAAAGNENSAVNAVRNGVSGESVCGDGLCEPDLGEIKENCPGDCQ